MDAEANGPTRDLLGLAAFRRIMAVLDQGGDSATVEAFSRETTHAIVDAYQVQVASFFKGENLVGALADPHPSFASRTPVDRIYDSYDHLWRRHDILAGTDARNLLQTTMVATQFSLPPLKGTALRYVDEFLVPAGLANCAAIRVPLRKNQTAVIGLFGVGALRLEAKALPELRVLAARLGSLARLLPTEASSDVLEGVHGRVRDVALLVAEGLSNGEIAVRLRLSEDTVKKYLSRVFAATRYKTRTALALAIQAGGE